jgi:hypothetical protein
MSTFPTLCGTKSDSHALGIPLIVSPKEDTTTGSGLEMAWPLQYMVVVGVSLVLPPNVAPTTNHY